jgi:hypothetical protein
MEDAVLVRVAQGVRDLACDFECIVEREPIFPHEPRTERLALDIGHDIEEQARGGAGVVQREDVGVGKPRSDLDLAQEAVRAQRG